MNPTLGIDNLKKVIDLTCELVNVGKKVVANGSNYLGDLTTVVGELPTLSLEVPAMIAAWPQVPAEVKDLDPTEAADLIAYTMAKLTIDNPKAIAIIEASFQLLLAGYKLEKAITS